MGFFVWLIHGHFRQHALALAGTAFLVCFVLVRASSMHYVDIMLFQWKSAQGISINNVMELGGIVCVIASAARNRDVV